MRFAKGLMAAALLLGAGCDDGPKQPAGQAQQAATALAGRAAAARDAAEERLRARLRAEGAMLQRAVQVHRQALAETLAVCGQVNASGRSDDPFVPYVAVVTFEGERAVRTELVLGASTQEATRVYIELVDRCFDGGGPQTVRAIARPLPPLPDGLVRPAPPAASTAPVPPPQPGAALPPTAMPPQDTAPRAAQPAMGSVTTTARHPVNVRAAPGGGSEVVRIVPRASSLSVFGEAPGGWLQVGEGEPWGWLHSSMLER